MVITVTCISLPNVWIHDDSSRISETGYKSSNIVEVLTAKAYNSYEAFAFCEVKVL